MVIGIMNYLWLTSLLKKVNYVPPAGVKLKIIDIKLSEIENVTGSLKKIDNIDILISSGTIYRLISNRNFRIPIVEIKITGFDFLLALKKASEFSSNVALITYQNRISYIDNILHVLNVKVYQITFNNVNEIDSIMDSLEKQGITVFIGSSLICEKAKEKGLNSVLIYSEEGVWQALNLATEIALTKKREMAKAEELQTIINFAHEGIIATNSDGIITVYNPAAEKITRIARDKALGFSADSVIPSSRLTHVMRNSEPEFNKIQAIGEIKILTNRIPILVQGELIGSVATFKDVGMIQEAEEKIRKALYQKGFIAKNTFNDIIGESKVLIAVKTRAKLYALRNSTILILGHSGTGKEIFAQAIHNESERGKHPFVAINCAALPPSLLESELFGYEEGAFTGAKKGGKKGLFELAHGGTIFLDEIGEMPMHIQSRLLRVLEECEVLRIGGERIIPVDIRVIAATNKNLWEMVKKNQFREDLYYRLAVLEIYLPSLHERKQDIPLLVKLFLGELRPDLCVTTIKKISQNRFLCDYHWPGNVRELRNIVERFAALYDGDHQMDKLIGNLMEKKLTEHHFFCEQDKIRQILAEASGNKTVAAEKLGISRTTLWRKLRQFNIE